MQGNGRIAVVGAGIAGLACARALAGAGHNVRLFDKGARAPGGRVHTRTVLLDAQGLPLPRDRREEEEEPSLDRLSFDDGAQYFTARAPEFERFVEACCAHGHVREWSALRLAVIDREGDVRAKPDDDHPVRRYVGVPTMHAIIPFLAQPVAHAIHQGVRVARIERREEQGVWGLVDDRGEALGDFEAVVVAIPPRQAADLLAHAPALRDKAASVHMSPCWALGLAFDRIQERLSFDGAFVNDKASPLSWIARNSSKPGRGGKKECWVLHGSAAWSTEHLEDDPQSVTLKLLDGFKRAVGGVVDEPSFVGTAFRWRYAIPEQPLPERFLYDSALKIGLCGDWCGGPRVEGAFMSGHLLGQHIADASGRSL